MKTRTILLSLLIVFAATIGIKAQEMGDAAPNFTLNGISGEEFTLSEHEGKVVFLFFFGNACSHCKANGPNTQTDIYAVYKDHADFVAIGIDTWDGNQAVVESYKATTGIEYDLLLNGSGVQTDYSTTYDRIIIIDQEGNIKYKATTNADKSNTAEAAQVIDGLLNTTGIFNSTKSQGFTVGYSESNGYLFFNNPFSNAQNANIQIIDMTGRVIIESQSNLADRNEYAVNNLQRGLYIIRVNNGAQSFASKFRKL